jgi:hypothetical protein
VRLFVDHEDWYRAFLDAVGEGRAPISVRRSYEHQCDVFVDARIGNVVEELRSPTRLLQAANVSWISRRGTESYSYRDAFSKPVLDLTFEGRVSYHLLEFEDMVLLDEIHGVSGQPVTGALAVLFRVLGRARAIWSRSALAPDGWQVLRGHGRKGPFARTVSVTVAPDGSVEKDIPADRPDLEALDQALRREIGVTYRPWSRE